MDRIKSTSLWKRTFESDLSLHHRDEVAKIVSNISVFRERAAALTSHISKALPSLTIHDATHLDALWETADLIAGEGYPFNPAEAFVFGGAVLLHDSALCFEAYEKGQAGLRESVEWKDALAAIEALGVAASPDEGRDEADFAAMRILHATRAQDLATKLWTDPDGDTLYLIESLELRRHYGALIGQIAASHHWPIEDIVSRLPQQINALPTMPRAWRVDPVKIACLLRCADAAHLDSRRAPDFLRALAKLHGTSADHWTAQNWLERVDRDTSDIHDQSLIFTSGKFFTEESAEAWWVAFDAIRLVDRELRASSDLLEERPQRRDSPPFRMKRVTGASSPEAANKTIRTNGWSPKAVEIHVSNLERLVSQLGGTKLYGEDQLPIIALREIIQNSRDAIVARRLIDRDFQGCINVFVDIVEGKHRIVVEDNGVGMSQRVITGPLLDFGSSFWVSDLVRSEYPGLLSSGYKPVGQFGIGFYSIFMVSNSVTVSSRRFDKGIDDVTQIRFPNGLSLRPLINSGASPDFNFSSSTRVEFYLKSEFGDPRNILIRAEHIGYDPEVKLPISQCLSIICAGLDVEVRLRIDDGTKKVVHQRLDELDTDQKRLDWILGFTHTNNTEDEVNFLRNHAERIRPIIDKGQIRGMAALSTGEKLNHNGLGTISTVGGLSTNIALSNGSRYVGCIDYNPSSARRDAQNKPVAPLSALQTWADEQIRLLPPQAVSPLDWCFATCSIADLECDPYDVFTTIVRIDDGYIWLGLDGLIDLICQRGLAFYRSGRMAHVEVHHTAGGVDGIPTFWPITNSAFLSLARDETGKAIGKGVLSCIDRAAEARCITINEKLTKGAARSHFGMMDLLVLSGSPSHP